MSIVKKTAKVLLVSTVLLSCFSYNPYFKHSNVVEAATTTTLTPSTTGWTTSLTISAVGADADGMKRIKKPDGTYTTGSSALYTVNKNGTYAFDFENNLGVITSKSITITNIDENIPFVWSSKIDPDTTTNQSVTIYIDAGDVDSGIKKITLPNGTVVTQPNTSYVATQNGDYKFIIEDGIGRITQHTVTVTNIDKTAPTIDSLALIKDENNKYQIHVRTSDYSGISSVLMNTGAALTRDIENPSHYFINNLTTIPTYIQIKDGVDNNTGNITFLALPTISGNTTTPTNQDVTLQLNGTGTLSYKKEYKTYSCSSKPCNATITDNGTISVISESGNQTAIQMVKVNNIDKRKVNFTLSGTRNSVDAKKIDLKWNKPLSSGTVTCETPEGTKNYSLTTGAPYTSYSITGKNFEYTCKVEGISNGTTVKSNWLTFSADFNQPVVFTKPSDSLPLKTFNTNNIFVERNGLGDFYIINSKTKNTTNNSVPIPTGV
ncbi:hypothetical protein CON36_31980 [Bacillus cereus]|uniref:Ig-like domain-containing protein n=1 Tax=Bacillus cereus TaxID=1396 RepID=A0A9X6XW04_BACCE|nr:hypothetical protein [Bacillus cereus]PDZ94776.1 hypothetical protein CON36_31980 [Bacillus cereus]